ncbi:MAG: OmpA family protein [Polyangiaceae bacterium]
MLSTAALVAGATSAQAQEAQVGEFSVQRLESTMGPNNLLNAERVRMVEQFGWSVSMLFNYSREPFVVVSCVAKENCDEPNATQVEDVPVIQDMFQWDVMGSFNPVDFLQLGLRIPLVYVSGSGIDATTGQAQPDGLSSFGLGDLTLEGKVRFFGDASSPVALGAAVDLSAPTGHATAENSYIGNDAYITVGWRGIFDVYIEHFFATVNLRGIYRGENSLGTTTVGPLEFRYSGGLGYEITPLVKVMGEVFGSTQFSTTKGTNTLEADASVVITPLQTGVSITVGGGAGIISGVGVPLGRAIGGIGLAMESGDSDGDGIGDNKDGCPTAKEDPDKFEDGDGCPEDDNDKDGITDDKDKCPNEEETINGVSDDDGCPDSIADADKDGIADDKDKCPDVAGHSMSPAIYGCPDADEDGVADPNDKCIDEKEDTDGFEDTDGCPDLDNDKDGVPDGTDECGEEPETINGFKDEDGCPDAAPDSDKDGLADNIDKCPNQPETLNGIEDEDGCPDKGPTLVQISKDEIKILQRVEFETNSDKIKGAPSFAVLDAVVSVLKIHSEITLIEVGGHTDNTGDARQNKELSQKRADAVKAYMVKKGIDAGRLQATGFGQEKPISENTTTTGKQKNRRVEFKILKNSLNPPP